MDFSVMWNRNRLTRGCSRISPLLTAYSEQLLPPAENARVAAHLDRCAMCAKEAKALTTFAGFLRAHPPQASAPAPNLWSRIEAQIVAEQKGTASPAARRRVPFLRPLPVFGGLTVATSLACFGVFVFSSSLRQQTAAHAPFNSLVAANPAAALRLRPAASDALVSASGAARDEAAAAAFDESKTATIRPTLPRKKSLSAARPDPFLAAQRGNSTPVRHGLPRVKTTSPSQQNPVQLIALGGTVKGETVKSRLADSLPDANTPNSAAVPGAAAEHIVSVATVLPSAEKPLIESVSEPSQPPLHTLHIAAATTTVPSGTEGTTAPPDTVAAREIPAAATTVAEMSAPSRRQNGLFSYQAR